MLNSLKSHTFGKSQQYNYYNLLIIAVMGFSAGLPLALTGTALQAWLAQENVSLVTIGMFGLVTQPYIYKFLWAPFLDKFALPYLGFRTSWVFTMQIALVIFIIAIAFCEPKQSPSLFAFLALSIAFLSATYDIAYDAYRTELLSEQERGAGSVIYVYAYRIAMIVSGGGSLLLSYYIGWQATYLFMALLIGLCSIVTLFAKEKKRDLGLSLTLQQMVIEPFQEFISRDNSILLLLLLITYKIGEAFSFALTTPFLIQALQFTTKDVGLVFKTMGVFATLIGLSIGGGLINKLGLYRSLFWFGVFQAVAILSFVWLAIVGHNYPVMAFTILIDQFASGLGTAALMVFLMSICNQKYTATQFALLSALAAVGRVYVLPLSGYFVEYFGWVQFFMFSFILSLPGLIILRLLKKDIYNSINYHKTAAA